MLAEILGQVLPHVVEKVDRLRSIFAEKTLLTKVQWSPRVTWKGRIDVAFGKTKVARIGEAWACFFHANAIPGRKADCPYFRAALLLSMELGVVHPLPKGSDIDGKYLTANRMELEEYVLQFKDDWKQFGVTIMCDSWTGPTSMSIINFMVYCNEKMLFHKSVNASGKFQNAGNEETHTIIP